MPSQTRTPDAVSAGGGWQRIGGGSDVSRLASNDGMTTGMYGGNTAGAITLTFNFAIPAGAKIYSRGALAYAQSWLVYGATVQLSASISGDSGTIVLSEDHFTALSLSDDTEATADPDGTTTVTMTVSVPTVPNAFLTFAQYSLGWSITPSAPTLTSPSGTIATLTPTFVGTHNASGDAGYVQIEVSRVDTGAVVWTSPWIADGGPGFSQAYAGPALTLDRAYRWRARTRNNTGASNQDGPYSGFVAFTPHINAAPTATQISPAAGATVGTLTPTAIFGFTDPDAGDVFSAYQIEFREAGGAYLWQPAKTNTTANQKTAKQASVVYAGPALTVGDPVEWRVRVYDAAGLQSAYTGWRTFTPETTPDPPTVTSPSGLQNTLTPSIAGIYNQATGGAQSAYRYRIYPSGGATPVYDSGDIAGAIGTGQAYGTNNAADSPASPPALTWATAYEITAQSKDASGNYSDWSDRVAFHTNSAPLAPSALTPSGGIVSDTTPTLAWAHNDPDGDVQTQARIYLYDDTDAAYVTGYNPKTLTQAAGTHTVTETLDLNHHYTWIVATKGTDGPGFGADSLPAGFDVATSVDVDLDTPTPDEVLTASAYTFTWTNTGGSGIQDDYRLIIYEDDAVTVAYDSGLTASATLAHAKAAGALFNGRDYYAQVTIHDSLGQGGQSNLVPFSTAWTPPDPIAGLSMTVLGDQA